MSMIPVLMIRSDLSGERGNAGDLFFEELRRETGEELVPSPIEEITGSRAFIYVCTGGSEAAFLRDKDRLLKKRCVLITSQSSNSLASAMEILSFILLSGGRGEIVHGTVGQVAARLRALMKAEKARDKLRGARAGVIGEPSDWLIASPEQDDAYRRLLDVSTVRVDLRELTAEAEKGGYPENQWTEALKKAAFDREETEKALRVYGAFCRVKERYALSALTVRCFDLLGSLRTTGCLGLAILNSEGITAGCEGDVPALVSMMILSTLSGEGAFMCNPSRVDPEQNEIVLAHCTLPLCMTDRFTLHTHYESGIGAAVRGHIPEGPCTLFKTDHTLSRHMCQRGSLLENLSGPDLCRTQVKLRVEDAGYFLLSPVGNHHILCRGEHKDAVEAFFEALS